MNGARPITWFATAAVLAAGCSEEPALRGQYRAEGRSFPLLRLRGDDRGVAEYSVEPAKGSVDALCETHADCPADTACTYVEATIYNALGQRCFKACAIDADCPQGTHACTFVNATVPSLGMVCRHKVNVRPPDELKIRHESGEAFALEVQGAAGSFPFCSGCTLVDDGKRIECTTAAPLYAVPPFACRFNRVSEQP